MSTITQRELSNHTGKVLDDLAQTGRAFVTRNGKPVAVLLPIDEGALFDYVLANLPEYLHGMADIDRQIDDGGEPAGVSLDDLEKSLGLTDQ